MSIKSTTPAITKIHAEQNENSENEENASAVSGVTGCFCSLPPEKRWRNQAAEPAVWRLLILLLSVASAFLDALEGQVRATYSILAVMILGRWFWRCEVLVLTTETNGFERECFFNLGSFLANPRGSLYFVTFLLMCMVMLAFFNKAAMGSNQELSVLTLGKPPETEHLVHGLEALCMTIEVADFAFLFDTIEES